MDNIRDTTMYIGRSYDELYIPNGKAKVNKLTPEMLERIRESFPNTKTEHIAKELGVSYSAVVRNAKKMGLNKEKGFMSEIARFRERTKVRTKRHIPRTGDNLFQKGQSFADRFGEAANQKRIDSLRHSMKEVYRKERARVLYGLPQKTNLKVVSQPRKKYSIRYFLKKRGYVLDEQCRIAYYNENTVRAYKTEASKQNFYTFERQNIIQNETY